MIARVSGWVGNRRFWRAAALMLCAGLVMTACGGAGGGGPDTTPPGLVGRPGVSTVDSEDGGMDNPGSARTLIVDGPPLSGAINAKIGGDTDFYTFRGVLGMTYTLQIFGFATPTFYLTTDDGFDFWFKPNPDTESSQTDNLNVMILMPDQVTQLANTTGGQGGSPYDIPDAGNPIESLDDNRILWLCPLTGDYYIRLRHERQTTGDGNYVIKLASAQNFNVVGRQRTGALDFRTNPLFDLTADPIEFKFAGPVWGAIGPALLDVEPLGDGTVDVDFVILQTRNEDGFDDRPVDILDVTFDMEDEPETQVAHIHFGFPSLIKNSVGGTNLFVQPDRNEQPPDSIDDPHPFVLDISSFVGLARSTARDGLIHTDTYLPGPDGERVRVPVTVETREITLPDGRQFIQGSVRLFTNATRGGAVTDIEPDPGLFRLVLGLPWYIDAHFTDDLELWSIPVVVSPSFGGIYGVFETTMPMSAGNVVVREGEAPGPALERARAAEVARGGVPFSVFYDSALQLFQIEFRDWDARASKIFEVDNPSASDAAIFDTGINPTGAETFVGLSIKVHRGGPGVVGPAFIDLGTVPEPADPIQFRFDPGIRTIISRLTDAEVTALRSQFYNGGFYVQVSSDTAPNGLLRAEGFLNLQINPNDGTVRRAGADDSGFGTLNFVSEYAGGGAVVVTLNGSAIGALIDFVPAGTTPECGAFLTSATVAAELPVARYAYSATAEDGTVWEGHVTVEAGSCETVVLTAP